MESGNVTQVETGSFSGDVNMMGKDAKYGTKVVNSLLE